MSKPCGHEGRVAGCPTCWRYAYRPKFRALWDGTGPAPAPAARPESPAPARVPLPCAHAGRPSPPPAGKDPRRRWYACEAGHGVVCPCSCGESKCRDYEPDPGG